MNDEISVKHLIKTLKNKDRLTYSNGEKFTACTYVCIHYWCIIYYFCIIQIFYVKYLYAAFKIFI